MSTRILDEAMEIQDEIFRNRRYIHQNAEVGLELPKTVAYVGVGAINNDPELNRELVEYSAEVCKGFTAAVKVMSSDDFSAYGDCGIPLAYAYLCCGDPAQGVRGINHNPSAVYDESALPCGTAALVNFSLKWLEKHSC